MIFRLTSNTNLALNWLTTPDKMDIIFRMLNQKRNLEAIHRSLKDLIDTKIYTLFSYPYNDIRSPL